MFAIVAHLSGALGLFFMGARLLTEHLKSANDRRLRLSLSRWTHSRLLGFAWGLFAGSIMQSTTVLTLVVVSMLKSDLVTSRRAFPLLLGGNVGVTLLVLIVMLDVKLMALYVLGIAYCLTLVLARGRGLRYPAMATACFGMALIVLGSIMLKESVMPLAGFPWVQQGLSRMGGSLFLPLLGGTALTFVLQSGTPLIVSGIYMAAAGLIGIDQVLMLYCGTCLGSSMILYVLTANVKGRARQVAMYQVLFNCLLNVIFLPVICIEAYGGAPLLAAAVRASGLPLEQGLALCMIGLECCTALLRLATLGVETGLVERLWPSTDVEALARPQFIHDQALEDQQAALRLVDLEQQRLLDMFSRYLDTVRRNADLGQLPEATDEILSRIGEYLDELAACQTGGDREALLSMIARQKLLTRLEEQVRELCQALRAMPRNPSLDMWSQGLLEGVDLLLLVLIDTLASSEAAAWPSTTQLMGDRSELLRKLRDVSSHDDTPFIASERKQVLNLANSSQHVFLLVAQLAHEYRQASGIDEAFLENADLEEALGVSVGCPDDDMVADAAVDCYLNADGMAR